MRRWIALLVVAIWAASLGAAEDQGADERRGAVRITVERRAGAFVGAMSADDLQVYVAGTARRISQVESVPGPRAWLLLIDVSMSLMRGGRISPGADITIHDPATLVRGIEQGFIARVPATDRLLVARFAGVETWRIEDWTSHRASPPHVAQVVPGPEDSGHSIGPSPIWDAVAAGARILEGEPEPRAIVLISDGKATANYLSRDEAAAEATRHGVPVFAMFEPFWMASWPQVLEDPVNLGHRHLRQLAAATGALFRINDTPARFGWQDPLPNYDHFIDAMRHQHVVLVDVTGLGAGRYPLEVRATDLSLTVHAPAWIWVE